MTNSHAGNNDTRPSNNHASTQHSALCVHAGQQTGVTSGRGGREGPRDRGRAHRHHAVPSRGFAELFAETIIFSLPDDLQSAERTRHSVIRHTSISVDSWAHPGGDDIVRRDQKCPGEQWRPVTRHQRCDGKFGNRGKNILQASQVR